MRALAIAAYAARFGCRAARSGGFVEVCRDSAQELRTRNTRKAIDKHSSHGRVRASICVRTPISDLPVSIEAICFAIPGGAL
jgi:hypothetical protein